MPSPAQLVRRGKETEFHGDDIKSAKDGADITAFSGAEGVAIPEHLAKAGEAPPVPSEQSEILPSEKERYVHVRSFQMGKY